MRCQASSGIAATTAATVLIMRTPIEYCQPAARLASAVALPRSAGWDPCQPSSTRRRRRASRGSPPSSTSTRTRSPCTRHRSERRASTASAPRGWRAFTTPAARTSTRSRSRPCPRSVRCLRQPADVGWPLDTRNSQARLSFSTGRVTRAQRRGTFARPLDTLRAATTSPRRDFHAPPSTPTQPIRTPDAQEPESRRSQQRHDQAARRRSNRRSRAPARDGAFRRRARDDAARRTVAARSRCRGALQRQRPQPRTRRLSSPRADRRGRERRTGRVERSDALGQVAGQATQQVAAPSPRLDFASERPFRPASRVADRLCGPSAAARLRRPGHDVSLSRLRR